VVVELEPVHVPVPPGHCTFVVEKLTLDEGVVKLNWFIAGIEPYVT
jgi:hypothetical protein